METRVMTIKRGNNDRELDEAAGMLREGALVAFPTETVYGLAVSAAHEKSIREVFRIKGRSRFSPLALHLPSRHMIAEYVKNVPPDAERLIDRLLPGPLMILLERADHISPSVTAGSRKIGIRVPHHNLATAFLSKAGVPVVATSANISGRFSPVSVDHVLAELGGQIDLVLSSGSDDEVLGIESTIIDFTTSPCRLARSGFITREQLRQVLGYEPMLSDESTSPHYDKVALNVRIILVEGEAEKAQRTLRALFEKLPEGSMGGLLLTEESAAYMNDLQRVRIMGSKLDMEGIARNLFSTLRTFEREGITTVLVEGLPREGLGWAIMERLDSSAIEVVKAE